MKSASTFVVVALLLCAIVLFVSAARDINPIGDKEIGAELARGRCVKGCCGRSIIGRCKVCCASAEEAKAFAHSNEAKLKDGMGMGMGMGVRGDDEEAKALAHSNEAKP